MGMGRRDEIREHCRLRSLRAGKSEIKRRYVQEHTFRADPTDTRPDVRTVEGSRLTGQGNTAPTQFRVKFSLKQKNKVVGSRQTTVEIKSGIGSDF